MGVMFLSTITKLTLDFCVGNGIEFSVKHKWGHMYIRNLLQKQWNLRCFNILHSIQPIFYPAFQNKVSSYSSNQRTLVSFITISLERNLRLFKHFSVSISHNLLLWQRDLFDQHPFFQLLYDIISKEKAIWYRKEAQILQSAIFAKFL